MDVEPQFIDTNVLIYAVVNRFMKRVYHGPEFDRSVTGPDLGNQLSP